MQHPTPAPVVLPVLQGRGVSPWRLLQVRRVVDGDTYEVQALVGGLARVRLVGVDAPEHDQPYGAQVLDSLTRLLRLRFVWVRVTGVDQYGRNLGVVRLRPAAFSSGRAVALDSLLVVRGWAWAHAPAGQAVTRVAQQLQAQVAGRGLWKCRQARVVRPGIWRVYTKQEKLLHWVGCAW
jgi:endonuclease YncB( thermonuclease family)